MAVQKEKLLDALAVYSDFDKEDYKRIRYTTIEALTQKATLIDEQWIPLSQMKCDVDGNLYVTNWMHNKLF